MKKLTIIPLSYPYESLEPVISRKIMELHHDKHYAAYVNGANAASEKTEKNREVMRDFSFNYNGAKIHEIFFSNLKKPDDNNKPKGKILEVINLNFGSFENFWKEFSVAATSVEGSGWAVLWKDEENNLTIGQLEKHNLLGLNGMAPILVLDVWEHAYYLDYQNDRKQYVDNFWKIINWEDVESRL
ncbi:MAG: superoxide dismutase [Candidatus Shapirobacteria bacterium]